MPGIDLYLYSLVWSKSYMHHFEKKNMITIYFENNNGVPGRFKSPSTPPALIYFIRYLVAVMVLILLGWVGGIGVAFRAILPSL